MKNLNNFISTSLQKYRRNEYYIESHLEVVLQNNVSVDQTIAECTTNGHEGEFYIIRTQTPGKNIALMYS